MCSFYPPGPWQDEGRNCQCPDQGVCWSALQDVLSEGGKQREEDC